MTVSLSRGEDARMTIEEIEELNRARAALARQRNAIARAWAVSTWRRSLWRRI